MVPIVTPGGLDGDNSDSDNEAFLVVDPAGAASPLPDGAAPAPDDGEHGALMRKIQAKKAALAGGEGPDAAATRDAAPDALSTRDREQTAKEVEGLREAIQALCRSTNPLGKIVDYIQEDVDSMRKEMQQWRAEHEEQSSALEEEAAATDAALRPMHAKLADVEQQIADQLEMISALRAQTHENDARIGKMLVSVSTSA